jgi:hypothetical protein
LVFGVRERHEWACREENPGGQTWKWPKVFDGDIEKMEMAEGFGVSHCRKVEMAGGFAGLGRAIGIDAGFVFLGARRCVVPVGGTPLSSWSRQVHVFSFLLGSA